MDGRPHPPDYAAHTWQGFSTGKWEGDMLTVTTTHLKMGWIRRNGIPRSDTATLIEHFIRHGNVLTLIVVINDPVYLDRAACPHDELGAGSASADRALSLSDRSWKSIGRRGRCRITCRGRTRFSNEFPAKFSLPAEAARGGAETMYPEYLLKLQTMKQAPRRASPKAEVAARRASALSA